MVQCNKKILSDICTKFIFWKSHEKIFNKILRQVILTTLFWNEPFQNQKFKKTVNDHYAEAAIDIVFKIGLLANLLSDNITAKFHYFSMKTEKCYMED